MVAYGSFTNSNSTDGGTNQDFGYGSLTGSFTNSNLTDGGTNRDFD